MIAGLEGVVASFGADHIVLNVGGVFYRVFMPASDVAANARAGQKLRVHTHLYVREDQLTLYGSTDERQLKMFESLLTVTGVGPKAALAILSALPVEALENAIATGNVDLLTRVPGIVAGCFGSGPKCAPRGYRAPPAWPNPGPEDRQSAAREL